ncbi:hypothetical protein ACFFVB_05440 [Formosa undariae]|uniref:Uncharacterized protein n=1 Tax=Formosa undariae TaxID=1325436 RepID=A0ABV5EZA0_9FLAO
MKYIAFIISLLFNVHLSFSQKTESEYLEKCDYNIKLLAGKTNEVDKWMSRFDSINAEYVRISTEKSKDEKYYSKDGVGTVYSFQYLNTIYNYLLPEKTNLVNAIGKELLNEKIDNKLSKKLDSLNSVFESHASTQNASRLQPLYIEYLKIRTNYIEKKNKLKVSFSYMHKPADNVYAEPSSINEYVIYDWAYTIDELLLIDKKTDDLEIQLSAVKYNIIKEPLPYVPILFQVATLLILISNLLVNFGFEAKTKKIIVALVILSMATSFILLFTSSYTLINSSINVFVPGVMYLIYYRKNKNKTMANNGYS